MKFTKMHGIGNDYVFVNCFEETVSDPQDLARDISPRHFAVGSDGLILIEPSDVGDVGMRIFNADGSEAEMCGNGIRCVARYVWEHGLVDAEEIDIETKAGIRTVKLILEEGAFKAAEVDMGTPGLTRSEVPMLGPPDEQVVGAPLEVGGHTLEMTCVSMGNPHCVIPVDNLDTFPCEEIGPLVETHELFPHRTNVQFTEFTSREEVMVTTWERGSGPTLACGTGAAAVCVACNLLGRTDRKITVYLNGGPLEIEWGEDDHVMMRGPAEEVFTGEWEQESSS
jgi:diaminopimelate epimerase